jgi:hypothetical protein
VETGNRLLLLLWLMIPQLSATGASNRGAYSLDRAGVASPTALSERQSLNLRLCICQSLAFSGDEWPGAHVRAMHADPHLIAASKDPDVEARGAQKITAAGYSRPRL